MHRCSGFVFVLINVIIPLVLGFGIYAYFNPDILAIEMLGDILGKCGTQGIKGGGAIVVLIRCYLADALWAYALTISVGLVLNDYPLYVTLIICMALATILEIAQISSRVLGTFDILDILIEAFSSVLAVNILNIKRRGTKNEKSN